MKPVSSNVQVERHGPYVDLTVGDSTVRLTAFEANEAVRAIERAIEQTHTPKTKERVH